ncbi:MAG: SPOR domain-containing protein [Thermodesulfovibrionia bacterium]|nr:SPOR domain-containing protein [Thermodesulfovibrionia bacterium]
MSERQEEKVIVIDDDHGTCKLILRELEAKGLEVIIISDPENAVEKAKQIDPDLIFISFLSFGSEGVRVCKSIHSIKNLKEVPVIMLISYPGELDPRYAATLGVVDVLVKPLNTDELVSKTMDVLGRGAVSSARYAIPREPLVEKEVRMFPLDEQSNVLEATKAESIKAPSELLEDETVEQKKNYADKEVDKDLFKGDYESYRGIKKSLVKKRLPIYAALLIFAGFSVAVLFFTDTGEKLISAFLEETPGEKKSVQKDITAETLPADKIETKKVFPSVVIDRPEESVAPAAETDTTNIVQGKKKIPPKKSEFFKKTGYSVQVSVYENEKNAVLFVDKLEKKGYEVFVIKELRADNRSVYRVLVGKFKNKNEALNLSRVIRQKEGIQSFVIIN